MYYYFHDIGIAILRDGLKEVPSNNLAALCQFS